MIVRSAIGAVASEVSADHRCSLSSGVTVTTSRPSSAATHSAAQARSPASSTRASGCSATGSVGIVRQRAAEVVPVAAHRERGSTDRAAEIEGEDLGAGIAPELQRHQRQQHALAGAGRADDQGVADIADMEGEAGTASSPRSWRRRAAVRPRCSSRSGPAQTAENGIMCARLSVEIGGWRTLA